MLAARQPEVSLKSHAIHVCWPQFLVFLTALAWSGCFQAVVVDRASIAENNEDDILVSTTEGDQVRFGGGDYHIFVDEAGQEVIQGSGKRFLPGQSQFETFEGRIPMSHVLQVSKSQTTAMLYVGIGAVALMIAFGIFIATGLHGGGFGG
jgi:hypothetical protein